MSQRPLQGPPLAELVYLVNHVFLPPKLPQQNDFDASLDANLVHVVIDSLSQFEQILSLKPHSDVGVVQAAISNLQQVRGRTGALDEVQLSAVFAQLQVNGTCLSGHAETRKLIQLTRKHRPDPCDRTERRHYLHQRGGDYSGASVRAFSNQ